MIEGTPRLLSVDELHRDGSRMADTLLHRRLGYLVENDAADLPILERFLTLENFRQMPCDRLTFTVRICSEQYLVGTFGCARNRVHVLLVLLDQSIAHAKPVLRVDGALLCFQVANVPVRG